LCHLWDNVEEYGRARHAPDCNIIQRIPFTCCVTKALRIWNSYCFSTATVVTQTCLNVNIVHSLSFCNTGYQSHPEALPQYFASQFNSHATYIGPVLRVHCTFCSMFSCYVDPIRSGSGNRKIASQNSYVYKGKGKAVLLQAWSGPEGSRKLRFPDFMTMVQDGGKVVILTHRLPLPPGNTPGTHFC
jgi:hypothetical protein